MQDLLQNKAWTHIYSTAEWLCAFPACVNLSQEWMCFLSAWTDEKSSKETHQYYSRCGEAVNKEKVLMRYYFQRGFDYSVILLFLEQNHATACLMRTLNYKLREYTD